MRIILAFALLTGCASSPAPKPAPAASSEPTDVTTTPASEPAPPPAEPAEPPPPPAPADNLPEVLDRAAITAGIDPIKPAVTACGTGNIKGKVTISVKVAPDGQPTEVKVVATPDAALGACVANAMQQARFSPSKAGGLFRYPFMF